MIPLHKNKSPSESFTPALRWVAIALLIPSLAFSATVTGSLQDILGTSFSPLVTFVPQSTPLISGSSVVLDTTRSVRPVNGVFTITNLVGGLYEVRFGSGGRPIDIAVPADTNTYNFTNLATLATFTYPNIYGAISSRVIPGTGVAATTNNAGAYNESLTLTPNLAASNIPALNYVTNNTGTVSNSLTVLGNLSVTTNLNASAATFTNAVTNLALTASRFMVLDANKAETSSGTSANLLDTLSDETGTGVAVFSDSPTLTTTLTIDGNGAQAELDLKPAETFGGFINFFNSAGSRRFSLFSNPDIEDTIEIQNAAGGEVFKVAQSGNATISGTLTAAAMTASDNLTVTVAGKGLQIKEGANARMGTATLVAGTVTVSTTAVTANSRIFLTKQVGAGGTRGGLEVGTVTAGTSFVINARDQDGVISGSDTSTVAWMLVEPAP